MITKSYSLNFDENRFWVQYTSLMLLILTFVLAVFFAPGAFVKTEQVKPRIIPQLGSMEFSSIFEDSGSQLNKEELDGFIFALSNHDLNSEIYVYGDSIETALSRSVVLYKQLINSGVPSTAAINYATVNEDSKVQARVIFYEARD